MIYRIIAGFLSFALSFVAGSHAADGASSRFINEQAAPKIYRNGWIDLNKNGARDPYEDPSVEVEKRITDLLGRMTIEEKTAQMATLYGFGRVLKDELPTEGWLTAIWKDGIGNIDEHLNGYERRGMPVSSYVFPLAQHVRALNEVQRFFVEKTRLGIPVDFSNEATRGLMHARTTSFPCPLAVGSTWNTKLGFQIGQVIGREARALGYTNVYSPLLDLARDPRWGRTADCYGEDPFLAGEFGMAQVRGIQEQRVVSTLKHFALYSIAKGGRDGQGGRVDSQASWQDVQTIHLYPFRKAVKDAGALGVMASYNDYDGVPIQGSRLFLTDILRQEWGFKGYVVSDSRAVEYLHTKHKVASDYPEAVRQSVDAGLNVRTDFTMPDAFLGALRDLVASGGIPMEQIDARVRDVLRVKFWLGLFDQPYREDPEQAERVVRAPEHLAIADQVARESIVLLKNENNVLPLKKDLRSVLVVGALAVDADAWKNRYGPQRMEYVTVWSGIRKKIGATCDVRFVTGCAVVDENFPASDVLKEPPSEKVREGIEAAVAAAKEVDAVIVVAGENDEISREAASRASLDLPGYQHELLRALGDANVPVVLVLTNGRPLSINWAAKNVPAIVEAWFPGEPGGDAIADVLFGDYNPAGRLPITFPTSVGHIPVGFPYRHGSNARDGGQMEPVLFPFGHGLSYTTFDYSDMKLEGSPDGTLPQEGRVRLSVSVTNSGARAGDEVVQLYLRKDYSSVIGFEKLLRGFERVHLQPGESRTLNFTLTTEHLEEFGRNEKWAVEPGQFTVMVGASSQDIRLEGNFTVDGAAGEIRIAASR